MKVLEDIRAVELASCVFVPAAGVADFGRSQRTTQLAGWALVSCPDHVREHGANTEEILLELDLDWDQIAKQKDAGVIR